MYVTCELTRQQAISNYYSPSPEHAFVVSYRFHYGTANEDIATFWSSTFGVTEPLTPRRVITDVIYESTTNYSAKDNLADCLTDDQSYYWDQGNQILYIHYNQSHRINTNSFNFEYGISIGLTDDKIRYFNNIPFMPFLVDFPKVEVSIDKFNYDKLAFIVDNIVMDNRSGFFNQFKDDPIYGNKILIKTGVEGDAYIDLVERAVYFVDDYNFSATDFILEIQDVRKTASAQIPNKVFSVTDYPDIGALSLGKIIPFAYSPDGEFLQHVPGYCINEEAIDGATSPDFIFLEIIIAASSSDIEVFVKDNNDVWIEQVSGVSVDPVTGIVTVDGAKVLNGSNYSTYPVKANVKGVANTYASDIIKDMNERFLSVNYDSSNYDITEWENEEIFLLPIILYMDAIKDVYEWIRELQSLSSVGFRYTNTYNNKRTIRVDNPNRDSVATVQVVQVINPEEVIAESNKDDVYNKIRIGYNLNVLEKSAPIIENIDYFNESFSTYKIEKVYNKISGLTTETLAIDRASIQAEDYYKIRRIFETPLIGKQYLDLRLYDVIEVTISLQTKKLTWTPTGIVTTIIGDEYFGLVRGQIVSIKPDYSLQTNIIRLRERPYSDVWYMVYGIINNMILGEVETDMILGLTGSDMVLGVPYRVPIA